MRTDVEPPSTRPSMLSAMVDVRNEAAWRRFLRVYEPFILTRCLRSGLNAPDAEDVNQTVLMALVKAMPRFQYDSRKRFRGYLTTVVLNAVKDLRSKRACQPGSTGSGEAGEKSKLESLAEWEFVSEMATSLDSQLSQDLRNLSIICEKVKCLVAEHTWKAYWQTAVDDVAPRDVAKELGMTAGAVYSAKNRVGNMLRKAASELGLEDHQQGNAGH